MAYLYLSIAIIAEVIATTSLKASQEFTRLWPSVAVVVGYGVAIYLMTVVLRTLSVGVTYAIWSGMGIVLVALAGWVIYKQPVDLPAAIGMGMIVAGVAVINLFSNTVGTS